MRYLVEFHLPQDQKIDKENVEEESDEEIEEEECNDNITEGIVFIIVQY